MTHLTKAERKTLNDAMDIIRKHTPYRSSTQLGWGHYEGCDFSFDLTFFSPIRNQHSWVRGETFADKFEWTVAQAESEGFSEDEARARRAAALRKELAELEASHG